MNEDNKNNPFDFASEDTTSYTAGEEAPLQNSSADDFHFVQQDKSIHDVKFNTKPTTFLRDALRRFSKNHSSVTGGIILGVLFLLAIILPFTMTFDVENVHSYEQNLPPKIFNIGTGFMDGSRTYENQTIPYDNDGNWIGEYSEEALCEIKNIRQGYSDALTSDGQGGYIAVVRNADETNVDDDPENPKIGGYLYSYRYNYKLENTYTLSYTLGWRDELDII